MRIAFLCLSFLPALAQTTRPAYKIETIAGRWNLGDGGQATSALLNSPSKAVSLPNGDLLIFDSLNRRIRKVTPGGVISTLAGTYTGYDGDGGAATDASFCFSEDGAVDSQGNIVFLDTNYCVVRKIDAKTGIISTIAGTGQCGNGALPSSKSVSAVTSGVAIFPSRIAIDAQDRVVISDTFNHRILRLESSGNLTQLLGTGAGTLSTDGAAGAGTTIAYPTDMAFDKAGNLYFSEYGGKRVRRFGVDGSLVTVAGSPSGICQQTANAGDGGAATSACFGSLSGIAVDAAGKVLYIADSAYRRVRKVDLTAKTITAFAGSPLQTTRPDSFPGFFGDGGAALTALFAAPKGVTIKPDGSVLIADTGNHRIRQVSADGSSIKTIAGRAANLAPAFDKNFEFREPQNLSMDGDVMYVADTGNYTLDLIYPAKNLTQISIGKAPPAGASRQEWFTYYAQDGVAADKATLDGPRAYASVGGIGLYFIDGDALRLQVAQTGLLKTVLTGVSGVNDMQYNAKTKLLVLSDEANHQILSVDPAQPVLRVVAGQKGMPGFSGDGGLATAASFDTPRALAIGTDGAIYIADAGNGRVRKIAADTKMISTVAGNGILTLDTYKDNVPATSVGLFQPYIALTPSGDLIITEGNAAIISQVSAKDGIMRRILGTPGVRDFTGDGGLASGAKIRFAGPVQVDTKGNIYVLDMITFNVRVLTPVSLGALEIVSGNGVTSPAGSSVTLAVKVKGSNGAALAGGAVTFEVTQGDAAISQPVAVSGSDGIASTKLTLGAKAGPVQVTATVAGAAPVTLNLTLPAPPPPAAIAASSGADQAALIGTTLKDPLVVVVKDSSGAVLAGSSVAWTVTAGDAKLSAATSLSQSDGTATVKVTMGTTPGPVTVQAVAGSLTANFQLTALDAAPAIVTGGLVGAGMTDPPSTLASPLGLMQLTADRLLPVGASARTVGDADLVNGRMPVNFQGACVEVNGIQAPVFSLTARQVLFQIPLLTEAKATVVLVRDCGKAYETRSAPVVLDVAAQAPELVVSGKSDSGAPLATTVESMVTADSDVTFVAVGLGVTDPATAPGEITGDERALSATLALTLNGQDTAVSFAGQLVAAPGKYGVRIHLPAGLQGAVAVGITVNGVAAAPVWLVLP